MEQKQQSEGNTIEIDGSKYEGGGQIIRNSMALGNILQKPFFITNIRSGRPNPGLNNQLLTAIDLMKKISTAKVTEANINSQQIYYEPQSEIISGKYIAGAKTAASISLMFQSLLPTFIYGQKESEIQLQGGTNVNKSPPAESIQKILNTLLQKMGLQFEYQIKKPGYYPQGNGIVTSKIQKLEQEYIQPIELIKRTYPNKIYLHFYLTNNEVKVSDLARPLKKFMLALIKKQFQEQVNVDEDIVFEVQTTHLISKKFSECYAIILHATGPGIFIDASYFPDKKQETAQECIDKAEKKFENEFNQGGCLDEHHQDQLLIYMALAKGTSQIRVGKQITPHTQAGFYILQKFIPNLQFKIEQDPEDKQYQSNIITITGIAQPNKHYQQQQQQQQQQQK